MPYQVWWLQFLQGHRFDRSENCVAVHVWACTSTALRLVRGLNRGHFDLCCGSSVVEHTLGKGEVESSILSHSTMNPYYFIENFWVGISVCHYFAKLWCVRGHPLMPLFNARTGKTFVWQRPLAVWEILVTAKASASASASAGACAISCALPMTSAGAVRLGGRSSACGQMTLMLKESVR